MIQAGDGREAAGWFRFPLYYLLVTTLLSKSWFAAGLQCPKLLWWTAHEPDAPELVPDSATRFIMDEGVGVAEAARAHFPDGVLIDHPSDQVQERVEATRRALDREEPAIFGATFAEDGLVVAVDILARVGNSLTLIEVKSSTSISTGHLWDVAAGAYVMRRAGVDVDAMEIMHPNDAFRFPETDELFARESISGRVRALIPQISQLVPAQATLLEGALPEVAVGKHCNDPRECPFKSRCWPALPRHHVDTFYGLRKEKSGQLKTQELVLVEEVPDSFALTLIQKRQRLAVIEGELQVEGDLTGALAPFQGRVAYLDFETVGPAIPRWDGFGPWHHHPVQFSCHITSPDGGLEHVEWLADGPEDSRATMAQALMETLENVDAVLAYNAPFKKKCLGAIADAAPEQAAQFQAISSKLKDLLPLVRDHVYHQDFLGSFSLKSVLPALVPSLNYESLETSNGQTASALLHSFLFLGEPKKPAQREAMRRTLLEYCAKDTLALVRLKERLEELAAAQA
jgi:hypothetical protein